MLFLNLNPKPPSPRIKHSHKKWEYYLKLQKMIVKFLLPSPSYKHFSDSGLSDEFLLKPVYSHQEELEHQQHDIKGNGIA